MSEIFWQVLWIGLLAFPFITYALATWSYYTTPYIQRKIEKILVGKIKISQEAIGKTIVKLKSCARI